VVKLLNEYSRVIQYFTHLTIYKQEAFKKCSPIRHNEPPHANSPDVASGTVVRRLRIDVHNDDNDNA